MSRLVGLAHALCLLTALGAISGCAPEASESAESEVVDVPSTPVEWQTIGNCWIYAQAGWLESMHLSATGETFDISQSYWTYWNWYEQISAYNWGDTISEAGSLALASEIVMRRGLMAERDFIAEDENGERSFAQQRALRKVNQELADGRLSTLLARHDKRLVREVLDDAWGLSDETRAALDATFGADGSAAFEGAGNLGQGAIVGAAAFSVRYSRAGSPPELVDATAERAIADWKLSKYPVYNRFFDPTQDRRKLQIRMQKALHDRQPVIIKWLVDSSGLDDRPGDTLGSFNLETLRSNAEMGGQGSHLTVVEDYEATTAEHGLVPAGTTLDPSDATDAAKLAALLQTGTRLHFIRIKNSWGSLRPDIPYAADFPGYHDLHLDYLDARLPWCPDAEDRTSANCRGRLQGWSAVYLPPGY